MYSINLEPQNIPKPKMIRSLSCNNVIETIPAIVELCRSRYKMVEPVAVYMGEGVYHVFELLSPFKYVRVCIIKDAN